MTEQLGKLALPSQYPRGERGTLRPYLEESINVSTTENLIIEADHMYQLPLRLRHDASVLA